MTQRPAEGDRRRSPADGEVILEFVRHGPVVRVSAMDPATLTEVVIQGPASSDPETLRALVLRKLDYALARARCRPA